ncbi:2-keto-4-pentenoate hydratase [Collimonas sp. OK242]|jgi:2-keto-4-pentenoate hydratase|uniref:fumarylacetoacetate hydrolase family protein n=1 Tax=Collimonas sp. OK242 TaxID=1798195 RepID=UPI00089735EE|nr:fumarylacetoacetate hydrolase family protein [Collimonas sp. OK242]SDY50429.1 2-keto-4-pentenoate hydratase [Collimonas sp. OK242]
MTSHTQDALAAAAAILAQRRRSGAQGARLPLSLRPPDAAAALAVQALVSEQLGDKIAGWKCGLPVDGQPVVAPIYAGTVYHGGACAARVRGGQVRVEPELAFVLAQNLPARSSPYSAAEIDAAIGATYLALELIDSRYSEPDEAGFIENLADGLLNQGLYLGPQVDIEAAHAAAELAIRISIASQETSQLSGRHPAVNPRAPLYWLAEFLRARGQGLQAGQAVITGSYAGSFSLPVAQDIAIRYGDLGELAVRFSAR